MIWIVYIWLLWWLFSLLGPKIIKTTYLPVIGLSFAPFIFYNPTHFGSRMPMWVLNHEKCHIKQQRILSPLIFIILYFSISGVIFIYQLFLTRSFKKAWYYAYYLNPFEKQARKAGWYS